jgi:hypothetical protein
MLGIAALTPTYAPALGSLALVEFFVFVVTRALGGDLACKHGISHKNAGFQVDFERVRRPCDS